MPPGCAPRAGTCNYDAAPSGAPAVQSGGPSFCCSPAGAQLLAVIARGDKVAAGFAFDVQSLAAAGSLVHGFLLAAPVSTRLLVAWLGLRGPPPGAAMGLVPLVCIYGYALAAFLPATVSGRRARGACILRARVCAHARKRACNSPRRPTQKTDAPRPPSKISPPTGPAAPSLSLFPLPYSAAALRARRRVAAVGRARERRCARLRHRCAERLPPAGRCRGPPAVPAAGRDRGAIRRARARH